MQLHKFKIEKFEWIHLVHPSLAITANCLFIKFLLYRQISQKVINLILLFTLISSVDFPSKMLRLYSCNIFPNIHSVVLLGAFHNVAIHNVDVHNVNFYILNF